jgi:hypothetical protein
MTLTIGEVVPKLIGIHGMTPHAPGIGQEANSVYPAGFQASFCPIPPIHDPISPVGVECLLCAIAC